MQKNIDSYYPRFDWLRIILASVVALAHDKVILWPHAGNLAVQIFFALSGWLIGGILLKLKIEDLPRFFFNRVLRIWVPYYFSLLLILVLSILKDTISIIKWLEIVTYKVFFVYNLFGTDQLAKYKHLMPLDGTGSHFWSVNAEEQFYLIAPLILVAIVPKYGRNILVWFILATTLLLCDVYASISFGVLAAVIATHYPNFNQNYFFKFLLIAVISLCTIGFYYNLTYYLLAPFFSLATILFLAVKGKKNSVAAFFGGVSYSMYLNHWIGVFAANYFFSKVDFQNNFLRKFLAYAIALGCCAILYLIIDKKVLAIRENLYTEQRGRYATIAAYSFMFFGIILGLSIKYLFPIELS